MPWTARARGWPVGLALAAATIGPVRVAADPRFVVEEAAWEGSPPRIREPCQRQGIGGLCVSSALERLYENLAALDDGAEDRLVRVSVIGDSLTADDHLPAALRDTLQRRFGDGGAGFVHVDQPTRWHQEQSGSRRSARGFHAASIVGEMPADRMLGPAGAAFTSGGGGTFHIATALDGAGARASTLRLLYLAMPDGGALRVTGDGTPVVTVSTAAPAPVPRVVALHGDDTAHAWQITTGGGSVRLFGADLQRTSGVVVDNLGLVSSSAFALARLDAAAWSRALTLLGTDLVIVFLGANDLDRLVEDRRRMASYADDFTRVLAAAVRSDHDQRACLVLSALDAEARHGPARVPVVLHTALVEAQREASERAGCAFFDAGAAVLDDGGMIGWQRRGYAARDGIHLTSAGARRLGERVYGAVIGGYERYRRREAKAAAAIVRTESR